MNTLSFSGRLGNDCQTNVVGDQTVFNISVGVSVYDKDDPKATQWLDLAYWVKSPKQIDYLTGVLSKGALVVGQAENMRVVEQQGKDGKTYIKLQGTVRALEVYETVKREQGGYTTGETATGKPGKAPAAQTQAPANDDDLPF